MCFKQNHCKRIAIKQTKHGSEILCIMKRIREEVIYPLHSQFNLINSREFKFRDFANFCHFCVIKSRKNVLDHSFAKLNPSRFF